MPWHYRLYAGGSGLARSLHGFINYAYMGNPYTDLHSFFSDERGPYCAPSMDANASNNSRLQSAALAFVLRPSKIANANNPAKVRGLHPSRGKAIKACGRLLPGKRE